LGKTEYDNYETILLDNASTDGSLEFVKTNFPHVKIVSLEKNYGFAKGCNLAVEKAISDFIVFLNNDTKVDGKWLKELVTASKRYGENNIYSSKILFYDQPQVLQTIGGIITPMGSGLDMNFGKYDSKEFNKVQLIAAPTGCSMLVKRSLFQQIGGFDADYFAFLEDIDLGWRFWLNGYENYYVPTSIVYHKFGSTGGKIDTPIRVFCVQKNRLSNMVKNFSMRYLIYGFMVSIMFDVFRVFTFLVKGDFKLVTAVLKGDYSFLREISKNLEKRKHIQRNRKISDAEMSEMGLIAPLSFCLKEYRRLENLKSAY
jgi:GT2 family glycosyltransferase